MALPMKLVFILQNKTKFIKITQWRSVSGKEFAIDLFTRSYICLMSIVLRNSYDHFADFFFSKSENQNLFL